MGKKITEMEIARFTTLLEEVERRRKQDDLEEKDEKAGGYVAVSSGVVAAEIIKELEEKNGILAEKVSQMIATADESRHALHGANDRILELEEELKSRKVEYNKIQVTVDRTMAMMVQEYLKGKLDE